MNDEMYSNFDEIVWFFLYITSKTWPMFIYIYICHLIYYADAPFSQRITGNKGSSTGILKLHYSDMNSHQYVLKIFRYLLQQMQDRFPFRHCSGVQTNYSDTTKKSNTFNFQRKQQRTFLLAFLRCLILQTKRDTTTTAQHAPNTTPILQTVLQSPESSNATNPAIE